MTPQEFWKGLKTRCFGRSVLFLSEVGSTNDVAKQWAGHGAAEGTVVVAEAQTRGRGRQGRRWASIPGKSLLFSLILRPPFPPQGWPLITLATAVAVARTCESFGIGVGIKWPNDLVVQGRKLCGILAETVPGKDKMTPVVVGIGVNLTQTRKDFPRELRRIATSLFLVSGRRIVRHRFLQKLLLELERAYEHLSERDAQGILSEWRRRSVTLGKQVRVEQTTGILAGIAMDIDRSGALLVKTPKGRLEKVFSGDVVMVKTKLKKGPS